MVGIIQTIVDGLPGIRLYSFGTNNKLPEVDVKNRLEHVKQKLKAAGISILVFSSDGDSREMKLMRYYTQLGVLSSGLSSSDHHFSTVNRRVHLQSLRNEVPYFGVLLNYGLGQSKMDY